MNTLKSMRIEVWTDGDTQMCAIRGESDNKPGLSYIWFVMFRKEFTALVEGKVGMLQDGYHKLDSMGDRWTFFDMQMPSRSHGEMTIPFLSIEMPLFVQQLLLRKATHIWEAQKGMKQTDKVSIELTQEMRDRWMRKYGQGKGKVKWNIPEDLQARVDQHKSDKRFAECLDRINQIALNRTEGWFDTAEVRIGSDRESYWWSAFAPSGKMVMNGGLVNHSRDDGFDWSIHT